MVPTSFLSGVECIRSAKNHPRYRLRRIAIVSGAFGIFFNILSIAVCRRELLHGLAFIPLCISMIWHHVDLVSPRMSKQKLPVGLLAFIDGFGFLSFLALIIANGIIMGTMWREARRVVLMTYTSVPWMVCCGIHGFIALEMIVQLLTASGNGPFVCSECCRSLKTEQIKSREATDPAHYSLLGHQKDDQEYDAEADADSKYMDSNAGEEKIHTPATFD